MDSYEIIFAPRDCFLCLLADGWILPSIVEPMAAHHGHYAVLMTRGADA